MRKILIVVCTLLLLTGCAHPVHDETEQTIPQDVSMETEVTISHQPEPIILSQEMAMLEGYVVMQDGDVWHNAGNWFAFLDRCKTGETCSVTVIQYAHEEYVRYDLTFDGNDYIVSFERDGQMVTEISQVLVLENGLCDDTMEPYDSYEAYSLNGIVLYRDMIAVPDYEGVTEIFLHAKEGEPAVISYTESTSVGEILQLLMTAEYMPVEPQKYVFGMKLLMTNRGGKPLVIELDLNQGIYRYGMQIYHYGTVEQMLSALGLQKWPDAVLEEFAAFIK